MTPNLILLNICSIALIGLLGLFALHNRKSGWVKHRTTVVEDLLSLQRIWDEEETRLDESAQPTTGHAAISHQPEPTKAMGVQLSSLNSALKSSVSRNSEAPLEQVNADEPQTMAIEAA